MTTDIKVNKPEPIAISKKIKSFKQGTDVGPTIEDLIQCKLVLSARFIMMVYPFFKRYTNI